MAAHFYPERAEQYRGNIISEAELRFDAGRFLRRTPLTQPSVPQEVHPIVDTSPVDPLEPFAEEPPRSPPSSTEWQSPGES